MKATPIVVAAALAGCALWNASALGEGDRKPRIEQLDLGTYWYGAEVGLDDLKGKVVLVELWGS